MLNIIYADDVIVVADKPHNLLSVPGIGPEKKDCLVSRLQVEFPTIRIIHRLDYSTSGLIVLALNAGSHRKLSMQFQQRVPKKRYQALVSGRVLQSSGEINLALAPDMDHRPKMKVDQLTGKSALTHWACIEAKENYSRMLLYPHTGRSHQLRVHMLSLGHPILGDNFYHPGYSESDPRMLLHADELSFEHPVNKRWVSFCSPCPF